MQTLIVMNFPCVLASPKSHASLCLFQWSTTVRLGMIAVSTSVWVCFRAFIATAMKDTHSMRMKQRAQVSEAHRYANNSQIPTTLQAYNYMPDTDILLTNIFQTHGTVLTQQQSAQCHYSFLLAALCCYKTHLCNLSMHFLQWPAGLSIKPLNKNGLF